MKKINSTFYLLAICTVIFPFLSGCDDSCEQFHEYIYYEPVYITTEEMRTQFGYEEPRPLQNPGKIYIFGSYLFINEMGDGIHVIDNSDKRNPKKLGFINIPGNFDMAVKDYILYADNYVDMLAIDVHDVNNIRLVKRIENIFPLYNNQFGITAGEGMILTEWEEVEKMEIRENCGSIGPSPDFFTLEFGVAMRADAAAPASANLTAPTGPTGVGGSMARFTITKEHLYAVDFSQMHVFNVNIAEDPAEKGEINLGWGIETIFPYKDHLFIGANDGMHIYNITTPDVPEFVSTFAHVTSCDPVVVNDEYAFVTLRGGTPCRGFSNQLDVIDITNLSNPKLVKSYDMENPHGLGLDENTLFLCDGEAGLKIFDATDVKTITSNGIAVFQDIHAFDVIPWQNVLLLIGEDGFYQYDYSDFTDIKFLSSIRVEPAEGK